MMKFLAVHFTLAFEVPVITQTCTPLCVENRGCALTREKLEFDAHHPDQVVLSPTEAKADGSIDIILGNRNGMTITRTEKDDAIEWLANRKQKIKSAS
jgi:hypothetical protein